jgi:ribosomal protein L37AE/L43A
MSMFIPKLVTFGRFAWVPPCIECGKTDKVKQESGGGSWWKCTRCDVKFHH